MKNLNKIQIEYILSHVFHWMIYAIVGAFASAFLLSKGYSNTTIGFIIALMSILSVFLQPLIANFIDNSKKEILMTSIMLLCVLSMALFITLYFIDSLLLTGIFYCVLGTVYYSVQPLLNSVVFKAEKNNIHINFGVGRAGGSIGYAISTSLLGKLILQYDEKILMLVGSLVCIIFILNIYSLSKKLNLKPSIKDKDDVTISYGEFLKNNPLFLLISLGVTLIFISNSVLNNYMLQIVKAIGGDSSDMGNMLAVSATLEVIPMITSGYLMSKISKRTILRISSWTFAVKITLTALCKSVTQLYMIQIVQLAGFAIFMPVMVSYISDVLSEKEAVRGQAMYTMAVTLSFVFASIFGGFMLDHFPVKTLLFTSASISSIGALLICIFVGKLKNKH